VLSDLYSSTHVGDDFFICRVRVAHHGVYGQGLIRELTEPAGPDNAPVPDDLILPRLLLSGLQFVSYPTTSGPSARSLANLKESDPDRYERFMVRRLGLRRTSSGDWNMGIRGTRMRLFEPTGAHAGDVSRGLVVHLSSLGGLDYELATVRALTDRGWAVLVVNASTARRDEQPVFVDPDSDMKPPAKRLAAIIDNRVAEIAYAAEAGVEYIEKNRPLVRTYPTVVAGYSAGALTAPAVAERLRRVLAGVVLVGGGANLLDISQRSSLTNGGIKVLWRRPEGSTSLSEGELSSKPSPAQLKALTDAYLGESRLDPYALAPRFESVPVLLIHCMFDDIVPTDTGELLYRRLGRPERLSFPFGHRALFWLLPGKADRIADWIDEATAGTAGIPSAAAPSHAGVPG